MRKWLFPSFSLLMLAACTLPALQQPFGSLQGSRFQSQNQQNPITLAKPEVIDIPSPNNNPRPDNTRIDTIVLHHTATASEAEAVGRFFARPDAGVSSHYIVDRSGYIVQSVSDEFRSWHAGRSDFQGRPNVNNFSIGIEICNLGDSKEPYSDAQYDALIRLMGWLVQNYQMPLENITRHRDIAIPAGRKIDTSNNFSVPRVIAGVQALLNGTYQSPDQSQPQPQPDHPSSRSITVTNAQNTLQDIADIYLDNPNRWVEIAALNPHIGQNQPLTVGMKILVPNDLSFYNL